MPRDEAKRGLALMQGTLGMLILRALLLDPARSQAVAKCTERSAKDVLRVEHDSLYPALRRLERNEWVGVKWETSEPGERQFRYYTGPCARSNSR